MGSFASVSLPGMCSVSGGSDSLRFRCQQSVDSNNNIGENLIDWTFPVDLKPNTENQLRIRFVDGSNLFLMGAFLVQLTRLVWVGYCTRISSVFCTNVWMRVRMVSSLSSARFTADCSARFRMRDTIVSG